MRTVFARMVHLPFRSAVGVERGRRVGGGTARITKRSPDPGPDAMSRKLLSAAVLVGLLAVIVRTVDVYTRPITDGLD